MMNYNLEMYEICNKDIRFMQCNDTKIVGGNLMCLCIHVHVPNTL